MRCAARLRRAGARLVACTAIWVAAPPANPSLAASQPLARHPDPPDVAAASEPAVSVRIGARRIAARVPATFHYGGGVWRYPQLFGSIEPEILDLRGGGTYRAALAWEVLAASRDLPDLRRKLASYRLNAFLQAVRQRGSRIIVSLDATPRWLSANRSEERFHDGPAWARYPPRDLSRWADLVQAVVEHFNGRIGLDAIYEVWNEPDGSFKGTVEQYFALYRASVLGARRADPRARIAGPAVSDWTAPKTLGGKRSQDGSVLLERFIRWAGGTPLPELGLDRQPIDVLTWHGFYRNPVSDHYTTVVGFVRGWLRSAGYTDTELVVDEWNIAAAPPYPEGDLNASDVGAAYVAASVIAMDQAGIDGQVFQMMVDPGTEGYSGGTFTPAGVPRPNFQVFRLLSRLEGAQLEASSGDDWVRAAAFASDRHLYVLLAVCVPTDLMFLRSRLEGLALRDPAADAEIRAIRGKDLFELLSRGGAPPRGLSAGARRAIADTQEGHAAYRTKRDGWSGAVRIRVELAGPAVAPSATHYAIDASSTISAQTIERDSARIRQVARRGAERSRAELERAGVSEPIQRAFFKAVMNGVSPQGVIEDAPARDRAALKRANALVDDGLATELSTELSKIHRRERQRAGEPGRLRAGPDGRLILRARPHSVHLLVFERRA
jgi:hypothetical protein